MTRSLSPLSRCSSGVRSVVLLAPLCLGQIATQTVSVMDATREAARQALDAGSYDEAETRAREWCLRVEAQYGDQSLELARALDLLVEAQIKNGKAGTGSTPAIAETVVRLKEQHLGGGHVDLALSLHNLGLVRVHRGEFVAAVSLHERGLKARLEALGNNNPEVADSLDQLAFAQIQLEQFPEAERRLAESRRIRESQTGESEVALARTLALVALLHRSSGTYALGVPPLESALAIRRRITPAHPEIIPLLQVQGDLRFLMGDIRGGQDAWTTAVQLAEKTLRPDHPTLCELLRRLGLAAFSIGNLGEARQLRERALRIGERSLAPCDPAVTALITGVANSRKLDGEFAEARTLYRKVQTTIQKCVAANHSTVATDAYATAIYNEAAVARDIGDLVEADRLYQRADSDMVEDRWNRLIPSWQGASTRSPKWRHPAASWSARACCTSGHSRSGGKK